jgi:L-fuconolactonase
MPTIDAHHHLWRFTPEEFGWLDGPLAALRRDFGTADLRAAMQAAGVDGAVAVQARQTLDETAWLLDVAAKTPEIKGVVGWAPIAAADFPAHLEGLRAKKDLKGLRHVIQAEPDPDFILGEDFNTGIDLLENTGLVYDILIFERHLPQTIRFVDQHPNQSFVLDHVAKPLIAEGTMEPWAANLRELARRPHVSCKVSGMVTEADPLRWSREQLTPYLDTVVDAFGPARLLAGSDWPVCLAGVEYGAWFDLLRNFFAGFTAAERNAVFGGNAVEIYRLRP